MSEPMMNGSPASDLISQGVKQAPAPGNPNYPPAFRPLGPQQPQQGGPRPPNGVGVRPPPPRLQRIDSRGSLPPRGPPIPGQPQFRPQQQPNLQPRVPQTGPQVRPPPPNLQQRPPAQQIPGQQTPRPTGNVQQRPANPGNPIPVGNFKRVVNALQSGQLASTPEGCILPSNSPPIFQQRPPQPGARLPGIFPQRTLPSGPTSLPPDLQTVGVPPPLIKQQSFTRKPDDGLKMENLSDKPQPQEPSNLSAGLDDSSRGASAKSRSYSISIPGAPEMSKPLTEEERRRSVSAIGATLPGTDGKAPSSLAFIQERIASVEGKSPSLTSLANSKESLHQNGKDSSKESPILSRPESVSKNSKEPDDDDDVVIETKSNISPPKSTEIPSSPSLLPTHDYDSPGTKSPMKLEPVDNGSKSGSPNKTPSPNLSTKTSVNGSQEDVAKGSSRPPSTLGRETPKGSISGSHEDIVKVTSRPPSGPVKDAPKSPFNNSQEDVRKVTSRPPSGLSRDAPKAASREDINKVLSRPSSGQGKETPKSASREDVTKISSRPSSALGRITPKSASREDVDKISSRPPSNIEKEPPAVTEVILDEGNKTNGIHITEGFAKELIIEAKPAEIPRITPTPEKSEKRPSSLETKTPDSCASTNGKDIIISPETDLDTSRGDLSSSPAPQKVRTPISESGRKSAASSRSRSRSGKSEDEEALESKSGGSSASKKRTPSARSNREGDNDSGVDESTQGNECSNGELSSPRKSSKIPGPRQSLTSPTKSTPSKIKPPKTPKTPDPQLSGEGGPIIKKVPMNKIQVGAAPSPNLKTVRSKIGSLDNTSYKPGGGKVKIENRKLDFAKVQPKIAAKNDAYVPGGGDKKIQQVKLKWEAKPKVGSLDNATHKPGGGDKKIETVKLDFKDKAKPKVASKDNITHKPTGGDVKSPKEGTKQEIEQKKLDFKVQSKVGSLDNVKHKPGGGDKKIFDDKDYLKQVGGPGDRSPSLSGAQSPVPSEGAAPQGGAPPQPLSDENLNQES